MARAFPIVTQFNGGEVTPRIFGRIDLEWYDGACREQQNICGLIAGPAEKRPGTDYLVELKNMAQNGRLLPFEFNEEQAYMNVANAMAMRFLRDDAEIIANDVTSAIVNGNFDTDISGWTDQSTGAASIAHGNSGEAIDGTFEAATASSVVFGDGVANGRHIGLRFLATGGVVNSVKIDLAVVATAFDAVAGLYTDNAGSPGTQVGSDSDTVSLASTGEKTFTWSSGAPSLSTSVGYWVVISDISAGAGNVSMQICFDQGATFASGLSDTITSISDSSGGLPASVDVRIEIKTSAEAPVEEGLFGQAQSSTASFGGGAAASAANIGLLFPNENAGTVISARLQVTGVTTATTTKVGLYTDNAGSPGTQIGGDSDSRIINASGTWVFTWSANAPGLAADTSYWVVYSDTGGSGRCTVSMCADQGADYAWGRDAVITDIADGGDPLDFRAGVTVTPSTLTGVLELIGAAGETAIAEQEIAVDADLRTLIRFDVGGIVADEIKVRVGTASGGADLVDDYLAKPGSHLIGFTTSAADVFLQFRNEKAKTITVDSVSIPDDEPIEVTTPWPAGALARLQSVQSGDTQWIFDATCCPYKLVRFADDAWALTRVDFQDGPYLPENTSEITLTMGATTGLGVTCTASQAIFKPQDVNRALRFKHTADWGWATIAAYQSATVVLLDIRADFDGTSAKKTWRLGLFGDRPAANPVPGNDAEVHVGGFPSNGQLHEGRLWIGGAPNYPQRRDASVIDNFETFAPGTDDDDPISRTVASGGVNAVRWMEGIRSLITGTSGSEQRIGSDALNAPLTPANTEIKAITRYGSAAIQPVAISDNVLLFVQRAGRKIRELIFDVAIDGFKAGNLLERADHLLRRKSLKLVRLAWQSEPHSIVWAVRSDGVLLGVTYEREERVVAWHRHPLGGSDAGAAIVEDVAVIPGEEAEDRGQDTIYLIVRRTIDGATKRYVERLHDWPDDNDAFAESFYVDSGLTYTGAATATIGGLGHLEGETGVVALLGDGTAETGLTVTSGQVTLSKSVSVAHIGLPYTARLRPIRPEAGARDGTAQGRQTTIPEVLVRLFRSGTFKIGNDDASLREQIYTDFAGVDDTVDVKVSVKGGWEDSGDWLVVSDGPYPLTVVMARPLMAVGEGR